MITRCRLAQRYKSFIQCRISPVRFRTTPAPPRGEEPPERRATERRREEARDGLGIHAYQKKFCVSSRAIMGIMPIDTLRVFPFVGGWIADRLLGDPAGWPHPVVWFGRWIAAGERRWNHGERRRLKGSCLAIGLIVGVFLATYGVLWIAHGIDPRLGASLTAVGVFYCLAGKTLASEVKAVFEAVERSVEDGRRQVARIVGRDTSALSPQEIRAAALETLAENLSDGVVAPMCWFAVLGLPGMMAYKMVNTLDSMLGYKNERYIDFGRTAAKIDDAANYLPARLTAGLMLLVGHAWGKRDFVRRFGRAHLSPNSGYPEAALAAILDCRFGGTHDYFGQAVEKPYIGTNNRPFTNDDMRRAIQVNTNAELVMGLLVVATLVIF